MGGGDREFPGDRAAPKAAARQRIDGPRVDGLNREMNTPTPFSEGEQSMPADMVDQVDRLIACASDALCPLPGTETDETPLG